MEPKELEDVNDDSEEDVNDDSEEVVTIPKKPKCDICNGDEKLWIKPNGARCKKHYVLREKRNETV